MAITPKEDLLRIQKSAREILKQVHEFCEKYQIKYTIWAGSLIGAVRHQGVIPWDDDIDIAMERNDFERFKILFLQHKEEYPNLFLQTSQTDSNYYFFGFAKIRNLETKGHEYLHVNMPFQDGVFLDIFPLDGLPGTSEKADIRYRKRVQLLELLLTIKVAAKFPPKLWQKLLIIVIYLVVALPLVCTILYPSILLGIIALPFTLVFLFLSYIFFTPYLYLVRKRDRYITKYKDNPSSHVGLFLTQKNEQYRMPREWFNCEMKLVPFDDIVVRASVQYDAILSHLYGNYMKFPPEEKRIGKHAYVGLKTKYDEQ